MISQLFEVDQPEQPLERVGVGVARRVARAQVGEHPHQPALGLFLLAAVEADRDRVDVDQLGVLDAAPPQRLEEARIGPHRPLEALELVEPERRLDPGDRLHRGRLAALEVDDQADDAARLGLVDEQLGAATDVLTAGRLGGRGGDEARPRPDLERLAGDLDTGLDLGGRERLE